MFDIRNPYQGATRLHTFPRASGRPYFSYQFDPTEEDQRAQLESKEELQ